MTSPLMTQFEPPPQLVAVVAMARNRVIGSKGEMPWTLPTDLRHFRELTLGRPMIMGRKTYESIGKALDGRDTIVLTRQADFEAAGVLTVPDAETAVKAARMMAASRGANEIVMAGGGEMYRIFLPLTDRIELTLVEAEPEGDTFFPAFETEGFARLEIRTPPQNPRDSAPIRFETWSRVKQSAPG